MGSLLLRPILTTGWLLALAALFRFWDLGTRIPGLMLWSALFVLLFTGMIALLGGETLRRRAELWRMAAWTLLVVAVLLAHTLVPLVEVRDVMVRTTVFVKVMDAVVAVWIMVRAMIVLWSGPARILAIAAVPVAMAVGFYTVVVSMPGDAGREGLRPLAPAESSRAAELERDVRYLAADLGERNSRRREALEAAAAFVDSSLAAAGYTVARVPFTADGGLYHNIEAALPGAERGEEVLVIGAHYDSAEGAPGADDNASGTAAMVALARAFAGRRMQRTVKFVAFPNEEPPFFAGPFMGSEAWAADAERRGERIVAMLSLETVVYYTDETGSRRYPPPLNRFYPDRGDFAGFVGNIASR